MEIMLSNPLASCNDMTTSEACYGYGWRATDVAAEIIKTIRRNIENVDDLQLRTMMHENLRVCYVKRGPGQPTWPNGQRMANHAKHIIIDEDCYYIGSQNLYVCDLAEWGVVIDNKAETKKCIEQYWDPMWKAACSEKSNDCDVSTVMNGLGVNRNGEDISGLSLEEQNSIRAACARAPLPSPCMHTAPCNIHSTCAQALRLRPVVDSPQRVSSMSRLRRRPCTR